MKIVVEGDPQFYKKRKKKIKSAELMIRVVQEGYQGWRNFLGYLRWNTHGAVLQCGTELDFSGLSSILQKKPQKPAHGVAHFICMYR